MVLCGISSPLVDAPSGRHLKEYGSPLDGANRDYPESDAHHNHGVGQDGRFDQGINVQVCGPERRVRVGRWVCQEYMGGRSRGG
jgi:hypothetical protein